jgi:hypothetical protein
VKSSSGPSLTSLGLAMASAVSIAIVPPVVWLIRALI